MNHLHLYLVFLAPHLVLSQPVLGYVGKDALNPTHDPEFHRCFKDTMLRRGKEKLQNLPRPHFCLASWTKTSDQVVSKNLRFPYEKNTAST